MCLPHSSSFFAVASPFYSSHTLLKSKWRSNHVLDNESVPIDDTIIRENLLFSWSREFSIHLSSRPLTHQGTSLEALFNSQLFSLSAVFHFVQTCWIAEHRWALWFKDARPIPVRIVSISTFYTLITISFIVVVGSLSARKTTDVTMRKRCCNLHPGLFPGHTSEVVDPIILISRGREEATKEKRRPSARPRGVTHTLLLWESCSLFLFRIQRRATFHLFANVVPIFAWFSWKHLNLEEMWPADVTFAEPRIVLPHRSGISRYLSPSQISLLLFLPVSYYRLRKE